jgi:hypothetical protein
MAQAIFRAKPFPVYTTTLSKPSSFYTHLPAYEDGTECSETSAYKIQTPRNYPKELVQKVTKFANLTFRGPCIVMYSYNRSEQDALFHNFILVNSSTCRDPDLASRQST